jgi:hypothetical protein
MTDIKDPWAMASGNTTTAPADTTTGSSVTMSAAAKPLSGITDPFGTSSQFAGQGGATWDPRVPFDEIADRTIVMVPRSFDANAKDPHNEGQTREEFRVDLVVLDGAPFSFTYKHRPAKDADPVEAVFEVAKFPFVFRSQTITQGQLVKLLKGIEAAPDKLMATGVLKRVPQFRDAGSITIDSIAESRAKYIEYVKRTGKTEPDTRERYSWALVDHPKYMTDDRWALARAWWDKAVNSWPDLTGK